MSEEEKKAIELIQQKSNDDLFYIQCGGSIDKAIVTLLNLIEKQQNRIDELEADLYSANDTINDYIEERNKLKDKIIGDRMEQFDDYVIYLIEKYLEIMGE